MKEMSVQWNSNPPVRALELDWRDAGETTGSKCPPQNVLREERGEVSCRWIGRRGNFDFKGEEGMLL